MSERAAALREGLLQLGFDEVRFAVISDMPAQGIRAWLDAGQQGEMSWMERTVEKRVHPDLVLPGARSIIMLGVNYWRAETVRGPSPSARTAEPPIWARYARHEDYHDTIKAALIAGGRLIERIYDADEKDYRYYVDTGPVLERGWAARAGLGFIGKNAMLISRRHGNWLFLAAILTRIDLPPDEPIRKKYVTTEPAGASGVGLLCGKCTRCLDACPTQAFPTPGVVDARRCISYQTIENRGIIPRELRAGIGNRIYGCDVCLEVCPWNRFAREGRRLLLTVRDEITELSLGALLEFTPERFAAVFRRTAIKRLKLAGLLRNACVAAGNSGDRTLLAPLERLTRHALPMVRVHAVWAVYRLAGPAANAMLLSAREAETDPAVLEEFAHGAA